MYPSYLVTTAFKHEVDCFCTEIRHTNTIIFRKGDRITLTEECQFVEEIGWYTKILLNEMYTAYVVLEEIESLNKMGYLRSFIDIELEINYYEYKVNEALDNKDAHTFHCYVERLERLKEQCYPKAFSSERTD
ncbi:hypothetical protein [Pontibacillus litoralis]|uniref:IDEAL domain-containing protein n=1 Tax=Pontibacillus litoralis JSM 072002 TaxID=1385512 RepID=A0A0A5G1M0_9BACI|nr:hypothetical protein [Pontibacillus litoralis]KGX84965.1 hypothetical protein N784_11360 [Pontibacillus litoralis JSM 072002]